MHVTIIIILILQLRSSDVQENKAGEMISGFNACIPSTMLAALNLEGFMRSYKLVPECAKTISMGCSLV